MTSANVSKVTAGMTVQTSASKKSGKDEQEAVDYVNVREFCSESFTAEQSGNISGS